MKKYPAKILLFGEYTVLFGGAALAIPYPRYSGFWSTKCSFDRVSLEDYSSYLRIINSSLKAPLDVEALEVMLEHREVFCSDIPIGQGLGSSGALAASVYDRFSAGALHVRDQKEDLSLIEGYFHGRSSGIDALVSYLNKPVCRHEEMLDIRDHISFKHKGYLWKTNISRSTGPLVKWYEEECDSNTFRKGMSELAEVSTAAIEACLEGQDFIDLTKKIGSIQFEYMNRLIPKQVQKYWTEISEIDDLSIKLCGAGAGGCYLTFSRKTDLQALYPELQLERIW